MAVTLLLPAVRFGRIPKREKQRMLLEMQNAMNNMMSNNSQLHSMLHGHQSVSPMEAMTSDAGSSTSSSSASDSLSSSNPSSPLCPQDSESVVSMDTNSSSSCASDSGEDESLIALNRQHQEAFAFGQQRAQREGQASPTLSSAALEVGGDGRAEEQQQQQQENWSCWNNNAVVGGYQQGSYSKVQHVSNTAYSEEKVYQQQPQQLNSTLKCEPSDDSNTQHGFNTKPASSGYNEPTSCVNNRAYLVSYLSIHL